ncbi:MAG: hypothetical protein AB7P49_07655 [Bdellovibrionales bacterium]
MIANSGSSLAYAVEGDQVVQRFVRHGTFWLHQHEGGRLQSSVRLRTPSDWSRVRLSRACLQRLGVPES